MKFNKEHFCEIKPFDFSILTERIRRIVKKERNIKVIERNRTVNDENLEKEISVHFGLQESMLLADLMTFHTANLCMALKKQM